MLTRPNPPLALACVLALLVACNAAHHASVHEMKQVSGNKMSVVPQKGWTMKDCRLGLYEVTVNKPYPASLQAHCKGKSPCPWPVNVSRHRYCWSPAPHTDIALRAPDTLRLPPAHFLRRRATCR